MLFLIEGTDEPKMPGENPWKTFRVSGASGRKMIYHAKLLVDKGLLYPCSVTLHAKEESGAPTAKYMYDALTNEGHEFLETIRDPDVWEKTKAGAGKVGSFGFDLVKSLAKGFIKTEVKKRTGIDI